MCLVYVHVCIDEVKLCSFGVIYNQNIVYITCVKYYVFFVSRSCFICISSKCCRTIPALVLKIGDLIHTPFFWLIYLVLEFELVL